jgi:hypothetical protein
LRDDGWTLRKKLIQQVFAVGIKTAQIMEGKIMGTLFPRSNLENMDFGCYDVGLVDILLVRIMGHHFSI